MRLQALTSSGFAASSEAALTGTGAACSHTLTYLDISVALTKRCKPALDFEALAALTNLRELHSTKVNWRGQGVAASSYAQVLAAMPYLDTLVMTVEPGIEAQMWVAEALSGATTALKVLALAGYMKEPEQPANQDPGWYNSHTTADTAATVGEDARVNGTASVPDVLQEVARVHNDALTHSRQPGAHATHKSSAVQYMDDTYAIDEGALCEALLRCNVRRFQQLHVLSCCLGAAPPVPYHHRADLAETLGLARSTLLLHTEECIKDIVPRGVVWSQMDHPHDMRAVHRKFCASD